VLLLYSTWWHGVVIIFKYIISDWLVFKYLIYVCVYLVDKLLSEYLTDWQVNLNEPTSFSAV